MRVSLVYGAGISVCAPAEMRSSELPSIRVREMKWEEYVRNLGTARLAEA